MKRAMVVASVAIISGAVLSSSAGAQGTPQTVELVKVDVQTLAAGYRASKVIGSSVGPSLVPPGSVTLLSVNFSVS